MSTDIKIIQTLYLTDLTVPIQSSLGFLSPEFNWMSWALSCLQLKQFYKNVELYTNDKGKRVLIDIMKLPYSKVHLFENEIDFPTHLYPYSKLLTYSLQNEPFIHVDGDVFIWERLNSVENTEQLIAQNVENTHSFYSSIYNNLQKNNFWLPEVIKNELNSGRPLNSYNSGVIGGSNIPFFKDFTHQAFDFLQKNLEKVKIADKFNFNLIFEQNLFYCLAKQQKIPVHFSVSKEVTDMNYCGYADFKEVPYKTKFIHLLGSFKTNKETSFLLAKRLRQDYPEYYYKIINECKNVGIPLFLNFYNNSSIFSINIQEGNQALFLWNKLYQIEKEQHYLAELAFSNSDLLSNQKFRINNIIEKKSKINNDGTISISYLTPNSYTKDYLEIPCDTLDEIMIDILKESKDFKSLCNELEEYFDEEEVKNEKNAFVNLIKIKLQAGCSNNIYLIEFN